MWPIVLAVVGAWAIAIGAAAQERPASQTEGDAAARPIALLKLLANPRWLAGAALTVGGVAAHLVALSQAPVTIVQPLGVSGLLIAVWVAARWRGRFLSRGEIAAIVAITVGLAGLVWTLPHGDVAVVAVPAPILVALAGFAVVSAAAIVPADRLSRQTRALLFAGLAGTCFGLGSALARVVVATVSQDVTVLWSSTTLIAAALMAVGGFLLQNAYRTGHFGLSYATLLIADPLVAATFGVVVLGEAMPTTATAAVLFAISAAVTVIGVVVLARGATPLKQAPAGQPAAPRRIEQPQP